MTKKTMVCVIRGFLLVLIGFMILDGGLSRAVNFCPGAYCKSPHMVNPSSYVRLHKGTGLRHMLMGSETELMDAVVGKNMDSGLYVVTREVHSVFLDSNQLELSYAFYFYPSQSNNRTEVEIVIASPGFDAEEIRKYQSDAFYWFSSGYISLKLLEKEYDPNIKEGVSSLALTYAAFEGNIELAYKLIKKGAKVDLAINEIKTIASTNEPYLDRPANKRAYDKANSAIKLLESGVEKIIDAKRAEEEKENDAFQVAVRSYKAAKVKPLLPEDARKFKVQAEGAVRDKDFADAVDLYAKAIKIAPWWPEGHFNRALVLAETKDFDTAIIEMKRYLALVPKAPNARAAQDKIYDWERKAGSVSK